MSGSPTSSLRAPLRLAILISGRGSNMEAVARACRHGHINARVVVVISDRGDAGGLDVARKMGIAAEAVPRKSFPDIASFENAIGGKIDAHEADVVVLAGFMRILSAQFIERYMGRIFNIHPALLPKYRGLHTHTRVLEAGDAEHGASVHFATPELDGGPVVLQSRLSVRPAETENELAARVLATEHVILPRVLGWVADGRLKWRDGTGWLDGRPLKSPVVEHFDEAKN